jgi:isoquinoline 1-oxidoreductase alpha subunit
MTTFDLNGRTVSVRSADDTPLLWTIRDEIGLTGTKFGCGIGLCGACTVHRPMPVSGSGVMLVE